MATAQGTLDLARRLAKASRSIKMYGGAHQQSIADLDGFKAALDKMLAAEPRIDFVLQGNAVLVQDLVQPFKDATVAFLVDAMRQRAISSISFYPGSSFEEVAKTAMLLVAKPEVVKSGQELRPEALQGLDRVRLNDIRFLAVAQGQSVTSGAPAAGDPGAAPPLSPRPGTGKLTSPPPPAAAPTKEGTRVVSPPAAASPAQGGTGAGSHSSAGGAVGFAVPASLAELLPLLEGLISQPGGIEKVKKQLIEMIAKGTSREGGVSLGEQVRQMISRLPEGLRDQLATPDMKAAMSAAVIAHQLETGADVNSLQSTFQEFAPDVGGAMTLLDAVTRTLQSTGQSASLEALEKAMKFLPMVDKIEEMLCGNVLIVDANADRRDNLRKALAERGYDVDVAGAAKEAAEVAVVRGKYDCLVMDPNLPDTPGHYVLSKMHRAKVHVPVVIASPKAETYMFDLEILSYPKKKFVQSVEPEAVLAVVKEIATPRARGVDESDKAERKRAAEIQSKLVPQEMPLMPGWEAAFVYKPAGTVGGDYVDIFPVGVNRTGLVIADVSGKGIPGAMVMVMVRSAFRMAAMGIESPREAVKRVNRLVAPDLKEGMFVTLTYGVLDGDRNVVSMVNCAHNPPFVHEMPAGKTRRLEPGGIPMGLAAPDKFEGALVERELPFAPGAVLLLYTDGLVEAMNEKQVEFGEQKVQVTLEAMAERPPQEVLDRLLATVAEHRGAAAWSDDIAMLALRCVAPPPAQPEFTPLTE